MSSGGVFKLISNTGQQDEVLMATAALTQRLKDMSFTRICEMEKLYPSKSRQQLIQENVGNWLPTLNMIERTHVTFINSSFKPFVAIGLEYVKSGTRGTAVNFGETVVFTMPVYGQFINDCVIHVQISAFSAITVGDRVRWCEFPGHRLFKNVKFQVNGNDLDEYGSDEYNAYFAYKLPVNKEIGYMRLVGQEVPYVGYLTPDPTVDEYREYRVFGSGPQTYKQTQPVLDLWIPLLFWFRDIQCALPSAAIPQGQTNVIIELENLSKLISYDPIVGSGAYTTPTIQVIEMYSNNIFLQPEIFKIFIEKFGTQLIRVHKKQIVKDISASSDSFLLNKMAYPVETMFVAFRPQSNLLNTQLWAHYASCTQETVPEAVVTSGTVIQINDAVYYSEVPTVTNLTLKAQGIVIFTESPAIFYNSYIPYRYGSTFKTPKDQGLYMINFNFNPNEYQPSGYLNVSRTREFYVSYNSTVITSSAKAELIAMADCINFVLIVDGSAQLRYIT
jgi:hypothetical protein